MELVQSDESTFRVNSSTYLTNYRFHGRDLAYFDRLQYYTEPRIELDVFGRFFGLAIVNLSEGQLAIGRNGSKIPLTGPHILWLPPHSIVEWHLSNTAFRWGSYMGRGDIPAELPSEPIAIKTSLHPSFKSESELFSWVANREDGFRIGKIEAANNLARTLKDLVDKNFEQNTSIAEYAEKLHVHHCTLSRSFQKAYGQSPIAYRNKKRVFEAMAIILLEGERALTVCHKVGFEDISRFNKQFRRQMNATPSQYRPR